MKFLGAQHLEAIERSQIKVTKKVYRGSRKKVRRKGGWRQQAAVRVLSTGLGSACRVPSSVIGRRIGWIKPRL